MVNISPVMGDTIRTAESAFAETIRVGTRGWVVACRDWQTPPTKERGA